MFDAQSQNLVLGIVGTGLMGRGIAQIASLAGLEVRLYDKLDGAAEQARAALGETFRMLTDKGRLEESAGRQAMERLLPLSSLQELSTCHCVVEAIVEDLQAKQALFRELENVVSTDCVLASNTSSLLVTAIASVCKHPQRVAGLHFFSPVPLMKLVEVIDAALTAPTVSESLTQLALRLGHQPVRVSDTPGFIVNHAGRGYLTEALRLLGENITDAATIDQALRTAARFRLGPFELLDLTGLDVSHPVMESIYTQYYQEPRYRPSPITRQRLTAGLLGRKSGRGFYRYDKGKPQLPAPAEAPAPGGQSFWISQSDSAAKALLSQRLQDAGITVDKGERPSDDAICLVLPLGLDCTEAALNEALDPHRTVAIDPLFLEQHATLMTNPVTA
ncbi:MAG: 3-hydroxyacyl-CoA dehydrogenase, partial [Gammaproteobacteria bacterium]|nr:3-hydroxyacyl-CoA dehydrogenase [Gammaproteobacteria bacterium]